MVTHPYLESAFVREWLARPAGPGRPAAPGPLGPQPAKGSRLAAPPSRWIARLLKRSRPAALAS
jgi:hypothetical protein